MKDRKTHEADHQGPTRTCPACGVTQHAECYDEHGCTTLGCKQQGQPQPAQDAPDASDERPSRRKHLLAGAALAGASALAAVAVPAFLEARQHGAESSAIGALKAISAAQSLFRQGDLDQDGVLDYGTLSELAQAGLLEEEVARGLKRDYEFIVQPGSSPEFTWWAIARPAEESEEPRRNFFVNHTGVIYYTVEAGEGICPCDVDPFGNANPAWACIG
ncbi:MAG TPA: hypothetical protein DEA08_15770 [Planctomycetes bacterium]|nr:hypothetical protein [Planctomycetota bacterium]